MEDVKQIVDEMKSKGIESAVINADGGLLYSTFAMEDPAPYITRYLMNNAQLLMTELKDEVKEIEIAFEDKFLVLVPLKSYIFVGLMKTQEDKKIFHDYIESIKASLS